MIKMSIFILLICFFTIGRSSDVEWFKRKKNHVVHNLNSKEVSAISQRVEESADEFEKILDSILIPRVPDSQGNRKVQEYITSFLRDLNWDVEVDSFTDSTPLGKKKFANIIATLDPKAKRHLTFACHFDSKLNREYTFLGAVDSAVPCAMMLNMAKTLKDVFSKSPPDDASDITLQFIFFDGEEAFVRWTDTDSLYGARHLAKTWEQKKYPENNEDGTSELDRMDVLVLLDLLGGPTPTFYNYFTETEHLYDSLVSIETFLQSKKLLSNTKKYFVNLAMSAGIQDDHIPFYKRGVRTLHLIPLPFPTVWHQESDNKDNLDFSTIRNLNKILWTFVVAYLHLPLDSIS
uniref:Glutaminyl-peptide cyclotransferase n=1 Tax=Hemiscolopendra marginata TaxID=943146 RepID=A0A646QGF7_9MYRI